MKNYSQNLYKIFKQDIAMIKSLAYENDEDVVYDWIEEGFYEYASELTLAYISKDVDNERYK